MRRSRQVQNILISGDGTCEKGTTHESLCLRSRIRGSRHRGLPVGDGQQRGVPGRRRPAHRGSAERPHPRARSGRTGAPQRGRRPPELHGRCGQRRGARHHRLHCLGHARRRRRRGRPGPRAGSGRHRGPAHARLQGGGRQEHRAGGHCRPCARDDRGAAAQPSRVAALRGGLEPRVFEGRQRDRRPHAPGPRHHRLRQRTGHAADTRAVRALSAQPRPTGW